MLSALSLARRPTLTSSITSKPRIQAHTAPPRRPTFSSRYHTKLKTSNRFNRKITFNRQKQERMNKQFHRIWKGTLGFLRQCNRYSQPSQSLKEMRQLWSCLRETPHLLTVETRGSGENSVEVITLPPGLHWLKGFHPRLFVRPCMKAMYEAVMACNTHPHSGAVVKGKSWWLSYCLYRLATDPQTRHHPIFFDSVGYGDGFLFHPEEGVSEWDYHNGYPFALTDQLTDQTIYLFDPAGDLTGRHPMDVPAFTIVAAVPHPTHSHSLEKRLHYSNTFYLPVWTLEALTAICDLTDEPISPVMVAARFAVFGGIPTLIFWRDEEAVPPHLEDMVVRPVSCLSVRELAKLGHPESGYRLGNEGLIHLGPHPTDLRRYLSHSASPRVTSLAFQQLRVRYLYSDSLTDYLYGLHSVPPAQSYIKEIWKEYAHRRWTEGGTHSLWRPGQPVEQITIPSLRSQKYNTTLSSLKKKTYYQCPAGSAVDGLVWINHQLHLFHVTLNIDEGVNKDTLIPLLDHLRRILPDVKMEYRLVIPLTFLHRLDSDKRGDVFHPFEGLTTLGLHPSFLGLSSSPGTSLLSS